MAFGICWGVTHRGSIPTILAFSHFPGGHPRIPVGVVQIGIGNEAGRKWGRLDLGIAGMALGTSVSVPTWVASGRSQLVITDKMNEKKFASLFCGRLTEVGRNE